MSNFRIYVACLAAYNNGFLHGEWIDITEKKEDIEQQIKSMLAKSPMPNSEEWAVHDHEGFGDLVSEYTGLDELIELANFINEYGDFSIEVLSYAGGNLDDAKRLLDDCYHGEFNNEEDFAYYWIHEVDGREIPEYLSNYIDYKAMAYDFFINDFLAIDHNHKIHVFSHY